MTDAKNSSQPQISGSGRPRLDRKKSCTMVLSCADCAGVTELYYKFSEHHPNVLGESSANLEIVNNAVLHEFRISPNPDALLVRITIQGKGNAPNPLKFELQLTQESVELGRVNIWMNFISGEGFVEANFPLPDDLPEIAPIKEPRPVRYKDLQHSEGMTFTSPIKISPNAIVRFGQYPEAGEIFKYRVWFGTTRKPRIRDGKITGFTSVREDDSEEPIHYGSCLVRIPKAHKIGTHSSSWWKRWVTGKDDRLKLRRVTSFSEETHWSTLRARIKSAQEEDRHAILYLHGFRTSFEDAALSTAQIGFDLQFQGAMAFFSWPSRGTLKGYWADEATIDAAEEPISEYLLGLINKAKASQVHVIAHSMGNRALLRVIQRMTDNVRRQKPRVKFGQVILAAPDVDKEFFQRLNVAYDRISSRTTLYVSNRDRAVAASATLHGAPRVGLAPPITIFNGVDTVQVSEIDTSLIGHGYVAEARPLLTDIFTLIKFNAPPESRMGLRAVTTDDGHRYWQFVG